MSRVQRGNLHTQGLLSPNSNIGRCHHDPVRRRNIFYFLHEPCQLSTRHAVVCVDTCRFVLQFVAGRFCLLSMFPPSLTGLHANDKITVLRLGE
jgi:hypothetical protein